MSETGRSVAVIGAGPAGLAAAWRLADRWPAGPAGDPAGPSVVVYEARESPGGRLRTEEVAGQGAEAAVQGADAAVQLLSGGYGRTLELLADLGLSDRVVEVPGRDALWRGGRAHGLHYGSATSMAASGALPMGLKLRLGTRYLPFLERHADVLDLNDPTAAVAAGLDGESIAAWGRRELGDDFVELMAYPLLAAYYGVTPEETSAALFHALARAGLHVSVLGVRGGFGPLARSMAEALAGRGVTFRTGARVEAVEPGPSGVTVRVGVPPGRQGVEHAAVVVATPSPVAAGLLGDVAWLGELRTRSTATLVLGLARRLDTGWFGLTIPRRAPPGEELAAVCVQSAKSTALGEGGDALVLIPAPTVSATWAELDVDGVVARALPALERVLPGSADRVVARRLVPLPGAITVPGPGHYARLRALDRDALPRGVALAGDYLGAPTVEGAVRSGLAAADRVADAIGR